MTLAFERAALRRLQQPRSAIVDAGRWARYVGLVTVEHDAVRAFEARHLVDGFRATD